MKCSDYYTNVYFRRKFVFPNMNVCSLDAEFFMYVSTVSVQIECKKSRKIILNTLNMGI